MTDEDNVRMLKVRPRRDLGEERVLTERMLTVVPGQACFHNHGFIVDDKMAEVECAACHAKLSPLWVLSELARLENRFHELHARYREELKRLSERQRTKCEHCGGMTRISRR